MLVALDPILSDVDWNQDFEFYIGSLSAPDDFTGDRIEVDFVWGGAGMPTAAQMFTLSTDEATIVTSGRTITFQVPAATLEPLLPGTYQFEMRRFRQDGEIRLLVLGLVTIERGLSLANLGGAILGDQSAGSGGATVQVITTPAPVRVIQSVPAVTVPAWKVSYNDSVSAYGASDVQDVLQIIARRLSILEGGQKADFSDPLNSGLAPAEM